MSQIYNSDKPILDKTEDKFNRYKFSKRIAETILRRENESGLVLGLYGVWGEGKSSVLNMIEGVLEKDDDILIIKFNPWRFKDEDALILNFLKNLSETLDYQLNNLKEKIGEFFKKYGSIGSVFNFDLSRVGESLSDTELEDLKDRVNDFLKLSEKKIVVIIDDIDRLDKNELFAIFKLIKLTGNFTNTYYILSFDDEMVASALSERYGGDNEESGYNFLEKIVQVPLRIPKALSNDLLNYTFELLDQVIKESEIEIKKEEAQNIASLISRYILHKISTPRLAVRYANSLSFLLPLLNGEVNNRDLILFEAVKIFYPDHYKFIKNNPEYFIESYYYYDRGKNQTKEDELNERLDKLNIKLAKNDAKSIKEFLKELFPYLKEALGNHSVSNLESSWTRDKKIASPQYFYRYFIYSVPSDQISDIYFDHYIESLKEETLDELATETEEILNQIEPLDYLNKIHFYEDELDWYSKKVLINIVASVQEKFNGRQGGTMMFSLYNPRSQAAITIRRLIASHSDYQEKIDLVKTLLSENVPFHFSEEILRWIKVHKNEEDRLFSKEDIRTLNELLLERALEFCKNKQSNLFLEFEDDIFALLDFWFDLNPVHLYNYFENLLDADPSLIKSIIYSLTTTIISSTYPDPYKVDFKKETYEKLKLYYDTDKIQKLIIDKYGEEINKEENEVKFFDTSQGQNEMNAMRQFLHWQLEDSHNEEKIEKEKSK